MGIVKYTNTRQFSITQALKDGWGKEFKEHDEFIGLKLQDRKKPKHIVTIEKTDWYMGIFRVHFSEGGWLCFDHAVEQFKCI
ncbi:hypothetical protein KO504_16950 [Winogradskyella psychrotolerans]|uniref:hypothetical protein n=1 Tax=Winogradskyella psychrotolerans TaxID=1344585 RepID=UPI001C07DBF3|nr:hypothetical protein [Winogradskyella psychrotolerans]MBU2923040.1 hypothetical protein [Winogradskyella psychrotolerans]